MDSVKGKEPAWTPGQWKVRIAGTSTGRGPEVYADDPHYDDGSEFVIADCGCSEFTGGGKRWKRTADADAIEANAHLIEAAKDLYAALEKLVEASHLSAVASGKDSMLVRMARIHASAALAKARGEK